jgi:hypothetical protein
VSTPAGTPWSDPLSPDPAAADPAAGIDTSSAHPARVYDYFIGGKNHFPADREVAEAVAVAAPEIPAMARANRAFLGRAVRYLAGQGVRQFLDIGTGLPSAGSTHEVLRTVAPESAVVHVDTDPLVVAHARVLLRDSPRTRVFQGDLREPERILAHPDVTSLLDFSRPVGILLVAVLHFVPDEDGPHAIVGRLRDAAAPGSHLVVSHVALDIKDIDTGEMDKASNKTAPGAIRPKAAIEAFFEGFPLVEPGLVQAPLWRPDGEVPRDLEKYWIYAGVGRKDHA